MGLLDDAIREHLDLKRRRGADPTEVERAEREALGPVRRNRDPGGESDLSAPDAPGAAPEPQTDWGADSDAWAPEGHDEAWSERQDALEAAAPADEWVYDEPDERPVSTPRPVARRAEPDDEPPVFDDEPFAPEPRTRRRAPGEPPASPGRPPGEHLGGETVEYDVEHAMRSAGEADEDMLEETPEFLQDAPEHDRLWFEQRPPRDFDFDS